MKRKKKLKISARTLAAIALFAGLLCGFGARLVGETFLTERETVYVLVSKKKFNKDGELTESEEHEYDRRGREICVKHFSSSGYSPVYKYTYDKKGNMLTMLVFSGDRLRARYEYEYDDGGNLRRELIYIDGSDHLRLCEELQYDERGNLLRSTRYNNPDGIIVVEYVAEYTYDEYDNILSLTQTNGDGQEIYHYDHEYEYTCDERGNLLKEQRFDRKIYPREWTEYTYDENDNMLSCCYYDVIGNLTSRFEYTYNENGSLKSEKHYSGDEFCKNGKFYDTNGALLKEEYYRHDGSVTTEVRYTYDKAGNNILVEDFFYRLDGVVDTQSVEYTYDQNGNLLSETHFDDSGQINYRCEYEYEAIHVKSLLLF